MDWCPFPFWIYPPTSNLRNSGSATDKQGHTNIYLHAIYWGIQGEGAIGTHPPSGSKFFHFMQFSANNLQNNRLAHILWELMPLPQENPGCATAM